MKLLIIRHGESEADLMNVHEGRADFPLTERGHAQAEAMAVYIASHYATNHIYASTLKRAAQTAQHLSDGVGLEISYEENLMEFNNGLLAGLPYDVAREKYPPVENVPADHAVYGMESMKEFRERAEAVLDGIINASKPEDTVAVISHGGLINQLWHAFLNLPLESGIWFSSGDTGIHEWEINHKGKRVVHANMTEHAVGL